MFLGRYKTEIALTLTTGLLVGVIIIFNDVNIQIRMQELKVFLQKSTKEDNRLDHIGLVMKYRLHKEMYENRISPEDSSMIELRVNAILSERENIRMSEQNKYVYLSVPVLITINFFRFLLRMPPISTEREENPGTFVDIAYYFERNKNYAKAIEIYDGVLKKGLKDRSLHATIMLHQGFCYSIMGKYKEARKKYMGVIKDYGDIDVAVTAAVLLRYLDGFNSEIERVLKSEKDSVEKGEKLYKLIAYRESYKVLKKIESTVPASEKSRIQFFKGRTLEELSETGKAIELYQQIITDDTESEYARSANRRIFIAGALSAGGRKIQTLALKNNRILKEKTLSKMAVEESKFNGKSKLNDESSADRAFTRVLKSFPPPDPVKDASLDLMIKQVEKKIIESEKKPKRIVRSVKQKDQKVRVYTNDGNIFTGIIVREEKESIDIRTSIGVIKIMRSKISRQVNL